MKLVHAIDNFLNNYTMYKVVMFGLMLVTVVAVVFGFVGLLPFSGIQISTLLITIFASCYLSHLLSAKLFKAITNSESYVITALILFFILAPIASLSDVWVTIAAGVIAMFSKYILAIDKKHLFNPAAIAVLIISLLGFGNGIWWAGSAVLLPFFLIIGLLVVRKIRRFYLLWPFVVSSLITILSINLGRGIAITTSLQQVINSWPLVFFGTIMLTEPLTTPPRKFLSNLYGVIIGILFGSQFTVGPIHASPEFALVVGNIFSYLVSPKAKPVLNFVAKRLIGSELYEFDFLPSHPFSYLPGQYLEWTIDPVHADSRGNRRYFTIASSPTEKEIKLGVKIGENHSSFKQHLLQLSAGDTIMASQLSGDFVLPKNKQQKLVFIAGGIGITPFRSMAKYLTDSKEQRDVTLFYACSNGSDFVYQNIFEAARSVGMKTIYVITHADEAPKDWTGEKGRLDAAMLQKHVSNFKDCHYYLSGPNVMVESYRKLLSELSVPRSQITTDYFPGF